MIQYISLKWFARNEGAPELWYLPQYACFRLVIRNIPRKKTLPEIKSRALLRKIVPKSEGSSVATLEDDVLAHGEDFFLFPGYDQVIVTFRVDGADEHSLHFLLTDKVGNEKRRVPLSDIDLFLADYTATVKYLFNFDIKLVKRVELRATSLLKAWKKIREDNVEQQLDLDRIRSVG